MKKGQGHLFELMLVILIFVLYFIPTFQKTRFEYSEIVTEHRVSTYLSSMYYLLYDQELVNQLKSGNVKYFLDVLDSLLSREFRIWKYEIEYLIRKKYYSSYKTSTITDISFPIFLPVGSPSCVEIYIDGKKPINFYLKKDWRVAKVELMSPSDIVNLELRLPVSNLTVIDPTSIVAYCNRTILPMKVWSVSGETVNVSIWTNGCKYIDVYYREKYNFEPNVNLNIQAPGLGVGNMAPCNYYVYSFNAYTAYVTANITNEGYIEIRYKMPCVQKDFGSEFYFKDYNVTAPAFIDIIELGRVENLTKMLRYYYNLEIPLGDKYYSIKIYAT